MGDLAKAIEAEEGRVPHVYVCPAGARTVGVGHNIDAHGLPEYAAKYLPGPIPDDVIDRLLADDIKRATDDARSLVPGFDGLPLGARNVLVHMSFQLGRTRLSKFRNFLGAVAIRDWESAASHMLDSKWAKSDSPARARRLAHELQRV